VRGFSEALIEYLRADAGDLTRQTASEIRRLLIAFAHPDGLR
jgi:hypothetical protein